jgi:hypothetical protein
MKKFFIALSTIMCLSCSENITDKSTTGFTLFANIDIYLKSSTGENILGSDKYPENSIRVRYLVGGKDLGYGYDTPGAILDNPGGFFLGILSANETGKGMRVFLNSDSSEEYPITYIHWNSTETDTIKTKYRRTSNSVVLEKLWLNDVLVWQVEVEGQRGSTITIVK